MYTWVSVQLQAMTVHLDEVETLAGMMVLVLNAMAGVEAAEMRVNGPSPGACRRWRSASSPRSCAHGRPWEKDFKDENEWLGYASETTTSTAIRRTSRSPGGMIDGGADKGLRAKVLENLQFKQQATPTCAKRGRGDRLRRHKRADARHATVRAL